MTRHTLVSLADVARTERVPLTRLRRAAEAGLRGTTMSGMPFPDPVRQDGAGVGWYIQEEVVAWLRRAGLDTGGVAEWADRLDVDLPVIDTLRQYGVLPPPLPCEEEEEEEDPGRDRWRQMMIEVYPLLHPWLRGFDLWDLSVADLVGLCRSTPSAAVAEMTDFVVRSAAGGVGLPVGAMPGLSLDMLIEACHAYTCRERNFGRRMTPDDPG